MNSETDPTAVTRVLLLTPPMMERNAPYPATAHLVGFLRSHGIFATQADLSIELACALFSRRALARIRKHALGLPREERQNLTVTIFLAEFAAYERTVEPALRFLQGGDPALAHRIASRRFLPEGPRFVSLTAPADVLRERFGALGLQDKAKYLATLFLEDLEDVIRLTVDRDFARDAYGEALAASEASFDRLREKLASPPSLVDQLLRELLVPRLLAERPDLVGLTVPFAGTVYGALRAAKIVRETLPSTRIALGGGYVNTELRTLEDPRIFEYVDFISLDDGEKPLLRIVEHVAGRRSVNELFRTFVARDDVVEFITESQEADIPQSAVGFPTYEGLSLDAYYSTLSVLNPMNRLWTDLRWQKLMLAHGCYWRKCSFCDVSLDYIRRYDASPVSAVMERMRRIIGETGESCFHFVDEAAPPTLLKKLSERILDEGLTVTWWGNIRFERAFTRELTELMAAAGCVAVSGGLEVASNRLLRLMKKGVTVEQVARVTRSFNLSGVMVHAYLMYGFPTQTEQETVDSLERVRQLFAAGCIQSGFWHRFTLTAHSPVAQDPADYGIEVLPAPTSSFARNSLPFTDPVGCDHGRFGPGLKEATRCFMEGSGLDRGVSSWFDFAVPAPRVEKDLIAQAVRELERDSNLESRQPQPWRGAIVGRDTPPNGGLRVTPRATFRKQHEGLLLLDRQTGRHYSLNRVASRIVELIACGGSRRQITSAIASEYEAPPERISGDVDQLLTFLVGHGFVAEADGK